MFCILFHQLAPKKAFKMAALSVDWPRGIFTPSISLHPAKEAGSQPSILSLASWHPHSALSIDSRNSKVLPPATRGATNETGKASGGVRVGESIAYSQYGSAGTSQSKKGGQREREGECLKFPPGRPPSVKSESVALIGKGLSHRQWHHMGQNVTYWFRVHRTWN